ncbi:helix-turn-helix transcriptional regulator [Verrucosispora sp. WMMA2044]|uniref:Helix-turn-helix transcriptional regulator n=1 Tax=Verrucosispora sioxanthis TaxID=2499994 RepID=A0A6M1L8P2_9ACTN|nr:MULTISPECIES: helix-turn-helix transcriptional regulator [Micromonospora]NEE65514.1 helix-turn-helix transcriptional regulator [Verrucosispora sioxanthis]NGM14624.1 helix-turn-helix transcriptional regulator [Verrucosispora sioxanthis]WBB48890.1 helix-turn-helix transcriptional regulator [Verrucosispora sp. WMMA2044]
MATPKDLPDVGGFIRDLRRNAKISLRQLAEQAGVSNPYLSQIERGLRRPSAEVLQQLASALRVSTPAMYLRAGLLDDKEGQGVLAAIAVDPDLTMAQKQSLTQIYETFRRENSRLAEATATMTGASGEGDAPTTGDRAGGSVASGAAGVSDAADVTAPDVANLAATGPTTTAGTPTEAVLESVAVTEAGSAPAPNSTPARKAARKVVRKTATAVQEEK